MIGTNLNLDLPSGSDPMATVVSKLVTALDLVQTSIADRATQSALLINGPFSLVGNALVDATSVQFAQGNVPTAAGSMYYAGGEFYAIDATGAVKLTNNGSVNVVTAGGFLGDYGAAGVNAAATYDSASTQFRFTSDVGVWADLVARSVTLDGTNGSVKFNVDNAINTARLVSVKSLPAAGVSLLVYNAATSTLEDAAVTAPTNALTSLSIATLTTTTDAKHSNERRVEIPMDCFGAAAGSGSNVNINSVGLVFAGSATFRSQLIPIAVGDRITKIALFRSVGTGAITVKLQKSNASAVISDVDSWAYGAGAPGTLSSGIHTIATPVTAAAGDRFWVQITNGALDDTVTVLAALYIRP